MSQRLFGIPRRRGIEFVSGSSPVRIGPISPFFIVGDIRKSLEFYEQRLGFELRSLIPEQEPFFAIVGRGGSQLLLKEIGEEVQAMPNPTRHEWAAWDAFVFVEDPDALAAEFESRAVEFHKTIHDRKQDSLRGFELRDTDGYVLFFGRPT